VQIIFNFSTCENVHTISKIVFWSFCLCIQNLAFTKVHLQMNPYTPTHLTPVSCFSLDLTLLLPIFWAGNQQG
jgi:hypothetical protein